MYNTSNNRASTRFSTYSTAPTLAPSIAPSHISCAVSEASMTPSEKTNPLSQDLRTLTSGLKRLEQPKLVNQRYAVSESKKEDMGKLALGAKLDRALGRRMVGQDASFTRGIGAPAVQQHHEKPRHVDIMEYAHHNHSEKEITV